MSQWTPLSDESYKFVVHIKEQLYVIYSMFQYLEELMKKVLFMWQKCKRLG